MKKEKKILLLASLAIFALVIIVLLAGVYNVSAVDSAVTDAIGVNPESLDNIPRTQEEAGDKASNYLRQEWNKLLTNNKLIGPIHNWSIGHPLFFQILFNEPYSFSLVFIWIVILWIFLAFNVSKVISSSFDSGPFLGISFGVGASIVLAQIGVIGGIVKFALKFIYAQEAWWMRLILGLVCLFFLVLFYFLNIYLKDWIKELKEERKKKDIEYGVKESRKFIEGVKEGQELSKEIRKLKKKKPFVDYGAGI